MRQTLLISALALSATQLPLYSSFLESITCSRLLSKPGLSCQLAHLNETGQGTVGVAESDVDGSLYHLSPGVVAERVLSRRSEHEDLPHTEHDGRPGTPRAEVPGTAHQVGQELAAAGQLITRAARRVQFVVDQQEGKTVKLQPFLPGLPGTVQEII